MTEPRTPPLTDALKAAIERTQRVQEAAKEAKRVIAANREQAVEPERPPQPNR